jgi:hypothetical protein
MNHIHMTKMTITMVLTSLLLASCGTSDKGDESSAMEEQILRINQITRSAANSFNTVLGMEKQFKNANRSPQRTDLDMFWMALQSTTRDLERMNKMLVENPELVPEAKNYWNGRIQENLSAIESSGMLEKRDSPVTMKLGELYGADRVEKEVARLYTSTHAIQTQLGISWTPYTPPASPAAPATP